MVVGKHVNLCLNIKKRALKILINVVAKKNGLTEEELKERAQQIRDAIAGISVLEVSELVTILEEKFGVTAEPVRASMGSSDVPAERKHYLRIDTRFIKRKRPIFRIIGAEPGEVLGSMQNRVFGLRLFVTTEKALSITRALEKHGASVTVFLVATGEKIHPVDIIPETTTRAARSEIGPSVQSEYIDILEELNFNEPNEEDSVGPLRVRVGIPGEKKQVIEEPEEDIYTDTEEEPVSIDETVSRQTRMSEDAKKLIYYLIGAAVIAAATSIIAILVSNAKLTTEIENLTTQIQTVKTDLSAEIQTVKTDLTAEIQAVKTDLTKNVDEIKLDFKNYQTYTNTKIDRIETAVDILTGYQQGIQNRN